MRVCQSLIAAILLAAISVPVHADPSTTSRLGWVTNGDVSAAVQVGNTLYIGGTFTRVALASGALGSFFGVSTITGEAVSSFPLVDGVVHAIEPDGAGGYYVGGTFTTVGGVARTNLAHVLVGGTVDPAFAPIIDGSVFSLAVGSSFLFVGGDFGTVNDESRNDFVALSPVTGATAAFPPPSLNWRGQRVLIAGANVVIVDGGPVDLRAIALDQTTGAAVWSTTILGIANDAVVADSRLIVGGKLLQGDGRTLVSLDVANGTVDAAWVPSGPLPIGSPDAVNALAVLGTTLYVGGTFSTFGGQPRTNAAAVDMPNAMVTEWAPDPNGPVSALAVGPASSIFLSGTFTQVNAEARETFAEVDAGGSVSTWVADVSASTVQRLRVDGAGALLVGSQTGVAGGSARTNLAAFDLSSDTLLPWAPAMSNDVVALGAIGTNVYVDASEPIPGPGPSRRRIVSAVDGTTGTALPWTPPASSSGMTLLGTVGTYVYLSGSYGPRGGLIRVGATTAAIDQSWLPNVVGQVEQMLVAGSSIFIGGPFSSVQGRPRHQLAQVDIATGALSPWDQVLLRSEPGPVNLNFHSMAIDGRTLYVAYELVTNVLGPTTIGALDTVTGLATDGGAPGNNQAVGALGVADGQLIVARDSDWRRIPVLASPLPPGGGVQAFTANRQPVAWNLGYTRIDIGPSIYRSSGLLVTPTDVILLGYSAATPAPVQGIAVLPRTPSVAPASLRATTVDNLVTLTWDAPSTAPAGGYIVDVGSESGTATPLSLPTHGGGPSISALAGSGTYYVRVRSGAPGGAASVPTNEIALVVGCDAPPTAPPLNLAAQVSGSNVILTWTAPPFTSASRYVLEAGSSTGSTNIGRFTANAPQTGIGGAVPPGRYFVRIHAANACGESVASSEIFFTVGSASAIPPVPTGLTAIVARSAVAILWTPTAGALGYVMEAGSAPGLSDIARLPLSAFNFFVNGVPPGVYYLRVRAGNAAGLSAPSAELVIVVSQ